MKKNRFTLLVLSLMICVNLGYAQVTKDAQALYDQGLKLKDEKKTSEALEKFKQAIAINADYTEAIYQAGWCQNDLQNYRSAIDYLKKARESWSLIPKVHFELGYSFEKSGNLDSAVASYNRCLDLKPDYSLAYKQLGSIAFLKEEYPAALTKYAKYEELNKVEITDYLFWYRKGFSQNTVKNYSAAKAALLKSLEYKTDYANTYLELGFAAFKLKQDEEAITHFKIAIEIDPKNYIPYNGIAEVYRDNKKDMDQAISWYKKALDINPMERKANFGLGYCLNTKEKYDEAIDYLRKAIEKEPTYTAAYVELGYSYFKKGKDDDALKQFDKAISLNRTNENARYYACLVYIKQKNKARAQKMIDELRSLSSKYVTTLQPQVDAL